MKPLWIHRAPLWAICLLLAGLLSAWGCARNTFTAEEETPAARKPVSFRFGAVHRTYADVQAQPTPSAERLTQCIYGDVVRIEQEAGDWYAVKVGPAPELAGWMHKSALTVLAANALYIKERTIQTIVIRQELSRVFVWPSNMLEIVMGTELPFIGETEKWYLVRLPTNDIGRIARASVYPSVAAQPLIHAKQPAKQVSKPPAKQASKKPVAQRPKQPPKSPPAQSAEQPPEEQFSLDFLENPPQRQEIIMTARRFLGKVYVWGGSTPRGFDCSGLSYFVYKLNGIELPRVSWVQFQDDIGKKIKKTELQQGDLVFFRTYRRGPSHVGIYIGNNRFIHASPTEGVTTSSLDEPYYRSRYIGAKSLFSPS